MKRAVQCALSSAAVIAASIGLCHAEALPKGASPFTKQEVMAVYAGKTAVWPESTAYFAPDMSVVGYSSKKDLTFKGTWNVSGNKICMNVKWQMVKSKQSGRTTDCWQWHHVGDQALTLWSTRYTGEKAKRTDYVDNERRFLKSGDAASKQYAQLAK